jgi:SAM-dependent methyltransferase
MYTSPGVATARLDRVADGLFSEILSRSGEQRPGVPDWPDRKDTMDPVDLTTTIDVERPSQARIYDYLLGGSLNFAADREAAARLIAMVPDVPLVAQANRAFLRRAVRYLVQTGISQFLDIGSGLPTRGNVHEIARQVASDSRVAYVDIDPVAVAHSRQILAGDDRIATIQGDVRRPEDIMGHPDIRGLLDLTRPVAILLVSVLHFVADSDDPADLLGRLRGAVAAGSYLVVSHVTSGDRSDGAAHPTRDGQRSDIFAKPRTRAEVERFFAGFDLVEPGLVPVDRWRPEAPEQVRDDSVLSCMHAGVGRKG